jgi:hypothetical protein
MGSVSLIVCQHCNTGFHIRGELPLVCPACQNEASWASLQPVTVEGTGEHEPPPYELTRTDRLLLRSLGIKPESE